MTREEAIKILQKEIGCLSHTTCSDCPLEKVCDPIMTTPFDSEYIEVYEMAIKALEQRPQFIIKSNGTIEQILSKTEETEESGIKYLNINVSNSEVEKNPDIVRLCSDAGNIEYVKIKSVCDSIHTPDFNNCKWIIDFNSEVQRTITINTAALVTLADRLDILERKLEEYEKIL